MIVSAPGKLILAGEWAVLEIGNPAIVAAINHRIYCEIQPNHVLCVELQDFGLAFNASFHQASLAWTVPPTAPQAQKLKFAQKAIECTINYLSHFKTFKIRTWSDQMFEKNQKLGFGSSAATVVAIVGAILQYYGIDISTERGKEKVFKLACIAHFLAQGNIGSGIDVAASCFGGILVYKRFDPGWLECQLKDSPPLLDIINKPWPNLEIKRLPLLPRMHLLVGWTGVPASTINLVTQVSHHPKRIAIYNEIALLVRKLISAWKENAEQEILTLIQENETLLKTLGIETETPIETERLRLLADTAKQLGAAGKLSGAGGGDCGLALYFDSKITPSLKEAWQANGIQIIDTQIDERGIS